LTKARDIAPRPIDKLPVDADLASAFAAHRDFAQALKVLDAMEKASGLGADEVAFLPVLRGLTQMDAGRPRESLAAIRSALAVADSGTITPGVAGNVRRNALRVRVTVEALQADAAAAAKTSAELDALATAQPNNADAQSVMHYGRAMAALAKGDTAAGLVQFDRCSREDQICAWQKAIAAGKAGNKTAAAAARDQALRIYGRDTASLVVRSRLTATSPAS